MLPSFAGYTNIWCGGGAVWDSQLNIMFVNGYPVVTTVKDTEEILFHSSACTFQGEIGAGTGEGDSER